MRPNQIKECPNLAFKLKTMQQMDEGKERLLGERTHSGASTNGSHTDMSARDSRDMYIFYHGVIDDLHKQGLDEMAAELLKIFQQKGIKEPISAAHPVDQPGTTDLKTASLKLVSELPSGDEQARGPDDPSMPVESSSKAVSHDGRIESTVSSERIPEAPPLSRNGDIDDGASFPGAWSVRPSESLALPPSNYLRTSSNDCEGEARIVSANQYQLPRHDATDRTLEAVRVDDIMTVKAEPLDEATRRRRQFLNGGLFCGLIVAFTIVLTLGLVLRDKSKSIQIVERTSVVPTPAPTVGADARFQLLQEFLIEAFARHYASGDVGRSIVQTIFDDAQSPQYRALNWLSYQDKEIEKSISLDFLQKLGFEVEDTGLGSNASLVNNGTDWVSASQYHYFTANATITSDPDAVRVIQRYALAVVFYAMGGATSWNEGFEFLSQGHECNWSGALQCLDEVNQNRITYIDLMENGLRGTIPVELSALVHLRTLTLSFNALTGTLPRALAQLTELRDFDVAFNSLSGTIPNEYYEHWLQLESLKVGENLFTGTIPPAIGNLEQLTHLGAERLYWVGTVPKNFFRSLTNLEFLEVSNQNIGFINDTLATEVGLCTNLQSLIYHGVELRGTTPSELGHLSLLSRLQLASNHMTGTIPSELGLLTAMTRLAMSVNALSGTLPTEFVQMAQLERLELQNTFLTGDIGFLCEAISNGTMREVNPLQFDLEEVTGCDCCTCCMY